MPEGLSPEERRVYGCLFNDISRAPDPWEGMLLSERQRVADYLWAKGWRREVRPEDVNSK